MEYVRIALIVLAIIERLKEAENETDKKKVVSEGVEAFGKIKPELKKDIANTAMELNAMAPVEKEGLGVLLKALGDLLNIK